MEPSLSFHEGESRFQTNPVFIRQSFFPDCRCLENFSIRNLVLVNRYRRLEDSSECFADFPSKYPLHSIPWKDSREYCFWRVFWKERERYLFGKWKMVLVISIFGLEKLDFRFEQGGEEGFGRILGLYRG